MEKETRREPDENLKLRFEIDALAPTGWWTIASCANKKLAVRMIKGLEGFRILDTEKGRFVYQC